MIEKLSFLDGYELRNDLTKFINEERNKINELIVVVNKLIEFADRASFVVDIHTPLGPSNRDKDYEEAQIKELEKLIAGLKETDETKK